MHESDTGQRIQVQPTKWSASKGCNYVHLHYNDAISAVKHTVHNDIMDCNKAMENSAVK